MTLAFLLLALGLALIGVRFKGSSLAEATTVYTACWGIGSVIGPLVVGAGMDLFGAGTMPFIILAVFALYLPVPFRAWRRGGGGLRQNS